MVRHYSAICYFVCVKYDMKFLFERMVRRIRFFNYGSIWSWIKNKVENEKFLIDAIFYLSLIAVILTSFSNQFYENRIENQFQYLDSLRTEDSYLDKYQTAKILSPFLTGGILSGSNPEQEPQLAYKTYLYFIQEEFSSQEMFDKEIKTVKSFDDLNGKIDSAKLEATIKKRENIIHMINSDAFWSSFLFQAMLVFQILSLFVVVNLEIIRLKKSKETTG